ncbi:MAG: ABC transporter substrate-binding protein, partial [Candidatus Nanohalobium sp.]
TYQSMGKIGKELNRETKASETVREMKEGLSELEVTGSPRIYCEEWMNPPMVSGNWIPGLIREIGGEYFIEEGERSRKFELEKLKAFDPEYIFLNVCGAGEKADKEALMEREGWQDITAVENGDVYVVDDALLNRPGPRLVEGARFIADRVD